MYTKDKSIRVTLRLNQEQFDFVKSNADILGVSPSEFLRMVINASMATAHKITDKEFVGKSIKKDEEGIGRENDKANINDIV